MQVTEVNVEAYDVDSLRKMVRILEYENRLLKDKLKITIGLRKIKHNILNLQKNCWSDISVKGWINQYRSENAR